MPSTKAPAKGLAVLCSAMFAVLLFLIQSVHAEEPIGMFFFGLEISSRVDGEVQGGTWGGCGNTGLGGQIAGSQITPEVTVAFSLQDFHRDGSIDVWAKIQSLDGKQTLQKKSLRLSSPSENIVDFDVNGIPYEFRLAYRKLLTNNYDDCFVGKGVNFNAEDRAKSSVKKSSDKNLQGSYPEKAPDEKPLKSDFRDEFQVRSDVSREVGQLFFASNYAELDRLSADYLKKKLRSPSGLWMSTFFHAAIENSLSQIARGSMPPNVKWVFLDGMVNQWIAASPKSPAAHLARAQLLVTHAWTLRGGGWAKDVPAGAWQPFHEYMTQAEQYLLEHKAVAGADPNWYGLMFKVAAAQQWDRDKYERLLQEALSQAPTYYQNYFDALDYLLPKWGGNAAEIEIFADHAVEISRATEGNAMYARIYWYAAQSQYSNSNLISDSRVSWPKMKAGFEDVMKKYPDRWNLNNYARFACEAKDQAKAKELMKRVGKNPLMAAWRNEVIFEECEKLQ